MKISPPSGDMLIKLTLGAAVLGALWYLANKAGNFASDTLTQAEALAIGAVQALNPMSTENVIYKAANTVTGGDNSTSSIGTRIYDFLHPVGNGALTDDQQKMVDEFNSRND